MPQLYDAIGVGYQRYRRPDPRIAAAIGAALGDADSVLNVGAVNAMAAAAAAARASILMVPSPHMRRASSRIVAMTTRGNPMRSAQISAKCLF